MPSFVLDASAILAVLQDEPGGDAVFDLLIPPRQDRNVLISAVNLCEVISKFVREGGGADSISSAIAPFRKFVVPFDLAQAEKAGWLRRQTAAAGLSLGDRACLALAAERSATVWTADRIWKRLDLGIPVRLIRD